MAENEKENEIPLNDDEKDKVSYCQSTVELSEHLKDGVRNILNDVTDKEFVSIYKTCYKVFEKKEDIGKPSLGGSSSEGRKYHSQFNDIVLKTISETIEETVSKMDEKLKELQELKLGQSNSTVHWRPPGNAQSHMTPFEYVSQSKNKKELEGKIEREQESLGILKTRLLQKRNKANDLHGNLLCKIDKIKELVTEEINDEQFA